MSKQKKFILQESEIPTQWYNIQADMPNKPLPPIHPGTKQPLGVDDLAHIFPRECCVQELDTEHRWIDIPEEVLDKYKFYRSTPLVRAYGLEEAIGTPAHIYFKNESTNPLGSHKINSALPQCYYAKMEGTTNVTTETGAGQWGAALSYAAKIYGLDCAVYQVKITMQQKPYRSSIMRAFGAVVEGSPSMSTRAGKNILTEDPTHSGSLGTAISEAVELATTTPNCKYTLGSVLNHVGLHQTIRQQLADADTSTMIAQTSSVDVRRLEVVTQREHGQQRRVASLVAKVVAELAACQLRTAVRLSSNELSLLAVEDVVAHEGESNAAEVGAATEAGNHHIGIFTSHLHLLLSLQTDDGLVQTHVVQHGAKRIFAIRRGRCQLNSLRNGSA